MNITYTIITAALFMALVAWIAYQKTKGEVSSADGYFLAGRGLTGIFIAGSLLLTNLSAEQLIGLNGQSYRLNMSNMGWEVTAGFAIIIFALYLLPKYLRGAFTTLPAFLSDRYDEGVRRLSVYLFMLGYVFVTIPSVLYSGSLAVLKLFDVPNILNISYSQSVWLVVWIVGIIGAIYAIFGGLKAVAVSDTINGIGLLIIGILMPVLGFMALGDGSIISGMKYIAVNHAEKLNAIGRVTDSIPFGTLFTGMIYANLFYWGTNQYVIQRTLGAKDLAEGQKGAIFTGFFKILVPFMMMLPGVIAFHLYGGNLASVDLAFPTLVSNLLPVALSGFFLAVLLGAVLSSFNSLLNSAATMFVLDIYQPHFNPDASDEEQIRVSKWFGIIVALISFLVAPMLMNAPDGVWDLIRRFTGFFNIPIIVLVMVGVLTRRVPALAAKVVVYFHVITYYLLVWGLEDLIGWKVPIHFVHVYFILFWVEVGIMLVISKFTPKKEAWTYQSKAKVDMKPWRYSLLISVLLASAIVFTYILFSKFGLAYTDGIVYPSFWKIVAIQVIVTIILGYFSLNNWYEKYSEYLIKQQKTENNNSTIGEEL
ncbi:solute:sodium symporter family transporter [Iocasia frigidifontis]|uniref:Solute:sodium symporter family transporter n=1 Tax=Iocasia fonsfrigidae TaxID=2682810 RepID=A0A8A7KD34_9FIRM|nr:solute:sodium symporter family transporter [Iocasia fonsfrigidae]QTL99763.1 solute:sodium symporter family transporter [Iocasia fonsfrigidae]